MKNKKENRRNREGFLWITVGLLLIAAALCLSLYNLYDSGRADTGDHAMGPDRDGITNAGSRGGDPIQWKSFFQRNKGSGSLPDPLFFWVPHSDRPRAATSGVQRLSGGCPPAGGSIAPSGRSPA